MRWGRNGRKWPYRKISFLISEAEILKSFNRLIKNNEESTSILVGSGDDAAVISSKSKNLVHSLDISTAGVHFPENSDPTDIAYRSISIALSDLAAMGAYPSFITIGLTSESMDKIWYERFTDGVEKVLKKHDIKLIGGDITKGKLNICVNVFGYLFNKPITRKNAKINDDIYVSGVLGIARQGLIDWNNKINSEYIDKFFRPEPRFDISKLISKYANSCIDISDGLMCDLKKICNASRVGAVIDFEKIPKINGENDINYGDDYELCFTASPNMRGKIDTKLNFLIGKITKDKEIYLIKNNKKMNFNKKGWDSFD